MSDSVFLSVKRIEAEDYTAQVEFLQQVLHDLQLAILGGGQRG